MSIEKFSPNEGLGIDRNQDISEFLLSGNYPGLLDVINGSEDKNMACKTIINSMFDFHQKSRVDSVRSLLNCALDDIEKYGDAIKSLVLYTWNNHLTGERFFQNPLNGETLFLDGDGELISFKGRIDRHKEGEAKGMDYISSIYSYSVLSGPNQGQEFSAVERPIPSPN